MFSGTMVHMYAEHVIAMMAAVIQSVWTVSVQWNYTCPADCTCGMLPSPHENGNLKSFDCSFAKLKQGIQFPKELELLNLKGSSLYFINNAVETLTSLQELDLSGNRIKSIGKGKVFQNLTNLHFLNLGKNAISTVFYDNLRGPMSLKKLVLSNNKINYIEDEAFVHLSFLEILDLEQNVLGSLYSEWFSGLKSLKILNLAHNRVHNMPASAFRPLKILEFLSLEGNRISTIDPRAFAGLVALRTLNLKDNLILRMPTAALQSLPTLSTLILDQNPVPKIKPLDFSHLSVTEISLRKMPELAIIDSKAFYNLINLTNLYITDNIKLSYIDSLSFMSVDNLQLLHLHNNNIKGIQQSIEKYVPYKTQISLYRNPLSCDCNIRWIRDNLSNVSSNITFLKPEHLICDSPPKLAHKLLKDININKFPKVCFPLILNLTSSQSIHGKVGDRKILECRALGIPKPKIHWLLPDGSLVNSTLNEIRKRFFPPGTLVYYHLNPTDAGVYTCVAENLFGTSFQTLNLTVTGIDIHLFPVAKSSTFVTLVWNGTERRLFPQYKIVYSEYDRENKTAFGNEYAIIASQSRKKFTIGRLSPDTSYQFCIGFEDPSGYWLQISCCIVTTENTNFMTQGISRNNNVAVVSIIFGLLFFLSLLMCIVSIVSRKYRQRYYECPDTTESVGTTSEEGSSQIPLENLYSPLLSRS